MPRLLTVVAVLLLAAPAVAQAATDLPPSVQVPAPPTVADAAVAHALHLRGVPYVWSGSTPSGFDCSGFTRYVYGQVGIGLDHSTYAQWDAGRHIGRSELLPGDLVFFGLGHVGMYIGHGRFIHASHTGTVVSVDSLNVGWYAASYSGAVRLPGSQELLKPPVAESPAQRHRDALAAKLQRQLLRLNGLRSSHD